ncbi:NAD-dependent deacylase [Bacillaceae bacterium SIJ1]|nr:NAD-dependent deacylase [Litoribacterium kuwaitense]NGP44796.1 NAD-dependent deacylase [Litoribacterium kuwaitense]
MEKIAQWLLDAKYPIVLTGAGMSTESGLPDFRSSHGRWATSVDPSELSSIRTFIHRRSDFEAFYKKRTKEVLNTSPHKGHEILAQWQTRGLIKGLITQNVDGFHQRAGSAPVATLHGNLLNMSCYDCHEPATVEAFLQDEPICHCGGSIRPDIVLFGEMLPEKELKQAEEWTNHTDLMLVLGTSLQVSPASTLPIIAKENGARLIIVNEEPTPLDDMADVVVNDIRIKTWLEGVDTALTQHVL